MMLTKGAIGNLINRYNAVLKKCSLMNTFGSLALAAMLVLSGVSGAGAAITDTGMIWGDLTVGEAYSPTSASVWIDGTKPGTGNLGNVTINAAVTPNGYFVVGNGDVVVGDKGSIKLDSSDVFWVSQGDLTVANKGTLSLDGSGSLHVAGNVDIQEGGTLTLNGAGNNQIDVGKNLTVAGTLERNGGGAVKVAGTLSAKELKVNHGSVTAGIATVEGSITIGGQGNSGSLTLGQLKAKDVTVGDKYAGTLTLGKAGSTAITEHSTTNSTKGISIVNGTLALQGSNTIAGGVKLGGTSSATLSSSSGNNTVDTVTVSGSNNTITVAQGGTLNLGTVNADGHLDINGAGITKVDEFTIKSGMTIIKNGTVQLDSTKLTTEGLGKLMVVVGGTAHFSNGGTFAMGAAGAMTFEGDKVDVTGGTLRVDGALTLKGGNSITVNTGGSASTDVFQGNIIANSLTTTKTDGTGVDLTIDVGKVQLVGKDVSGNLFTGANSSNKITVDTNGKLVLGATKDLGLQSGSFGGTINEISGAGTVQFGHGNFTVNNFSANALFKDDTGWSNKETPNTVTLGSDASVAYDGGGKLTLGEGWFTVSNGLTATNGAIKIAVETGKTGGYVGTITLGSSGSLTTGAGHEGVYTITELVVNGGGTVDISSGKVVTDTLSLRGGVTLGTSGTGTWEIGSISGSGAGGSTFKTASGSTLLIGGDVSLAYSSKTQFTSGSDTYNLENEGTFGTIGSLTFEATAGKMITIGEISAGAGNYTGSYIAGTVVSNEDNTTLTIAGGEKLTVLGDGKKFFTKVDSITVGSSGDGTLALGGVGTSYGGKYEGTITLGNGGNKGTLEFNGGTIELSTVVVAADAQADYVFNKGTTNLTINTGASESNLKAGINLNGADQTVTLKNNAIATVNGGINVTTGTVNLAGGTLNNDITLDNATIDKAKIDVATNTKNTVKSITVASGGTVALAADSTLVVNSNLDLSKALLKMTAGTATDKTTTLAVNGTLTTGAVRDMFASGAGNFYIAGGAGSATVAATGLWKVVDTDGTTAAAIDLADDSNNVNLVIATAGIKASDFNIGIGDTVTLQGKGGDITLTGTDAVLDVKGTLNVGDATVTSAWKTDKVTVSQAGSGAAGALNVNNGSLTVNTLDLSKGTITVGTAGDDKIAATSGKLFVTEFTKPTADNGSAFNITKGAAYFGTVNADFTAAANKVQAETKAVAMLAVNKAVDFSNVDMVVGTKLQHDGLFTNNTGNIEFGADSVTLIGYDAAQSGFAITTNGDVFIDKGAKLELYRDGGLQVGDNYKILQTSAGGKIGNLWEASNVLSSQRLLTLMLSEGHNEVSGTITAGNAETGFGNKLDSDLIHLLQNMVASSGVDVASENYGLRFLSRSSDRNFIADDAKAAATIEGGAKIAFAGAAPQMAMNLANNAGALSGLRNSLSAAPQGAAVALNDEGLVAHEGLSAGDGMQNGFGLWVMPTYQNQQGFGLESGNFDTGYKSNAAGVILGADYTFNDMFRVGAQFNVGGGYAESTGDFNSTNNRFKYWGLGLYAGYQYENIGVTADFGYSKNHNEMEQNLPDGMQMANLKADAQSDTITAGLRGEYKFATEAMDIVPHLGVRMTNTHLGSFDVKSDKHTIFKADDVNATVWTFPVGVTLSKDIETGNGWTIKPSLDLAVIPAAGDIEAKQDINVVGVSGTAQLESSIMDAISYQGSLGLSAKNDNGVSVGINYTVQAGAHTTDQGVQATLRYDF
jgi:hypothetical protein